MSSTVETVVEFLVKLYKKGLSYSSINTARSALSTIISIDGVNVGEHPLVVRCLKGIFNLRPALPKNKDIWNPDEVLRKLKLISPAHVLTLRQLTLKLVLLLALVTGQRVQTLHLLDLGNLQKTDECYVFTINECIKTTRPGKHIAPLKLYKFKESPSLCVYLYLTEYIDRTKPLRGNDNRLLITYMKPYTAVSKQTISRWIRFQLKICGVDINKYSAHSTKSASTSKVSKFLPIEHILKAANWSNESTFARFYKKELNKDNLFANTLLNGI